MDSLIEIWRNYEFKEHANNSTNYSEFQPGRYDRLPEPQKYTKVAVARNSADMVRYRAMKLAY